MKPYKRTQKLLPRILELRQQGLPYRAIAKRVGMQTSAVHMLCKRYTITAPPKYPLYPRFPGVLALARARHQQVKRERAKELASYWEGAA